MDNLQLPINCRKTTWQVMLDNFNSRCETDPEKRCTERSRSVEVTVILTLSNFKDLTESVSSTNSFLFEGQEPITISDEINKIISRHYNYTPNYGE